MITGIYKVAMVVLGLVILQPQCGFIGLVAGSFVLSMGARISFTHKGKIV